MFAALSQYESRFKSIELLMHSNAAILEMLLEKLVVVNHRIDQIHENLRFVLNAIPDSDFDDEKKECE
jgi:hypothetical protein